MKFRILANVVVSMRMKLFSVFIVRDFFVILPLSPLK
jgi:hypothetical protein